METAFCFNLAMRKSNRLITQFYEEKLSQVGLKSGQYSILRAVNYEKVTSNKELRNILVIDQTTLSRNLKPLFRDGYLEQFPDPDDSRIKNISLTPKGKAMYEKSHPIWMKAQAELEKKLGKVESQQILSLSTSIVKALAAR